jgi:hypothetical protein
MDALKRSPAQDAEPKQSIPSGVSRGSERETVARLFRQEGAGIVIRGGAAKGRHAIGTPDRRTYLASFNPGDTVIAAKLDRLSPSALDARGALAIHQARYRAASD